MAGRTQTRLAGPPRAWRRIASPPPQSGAGEQTAQVGCDLLCRVVRLTEQAGAAAAVEDEYRAAVVDFVVAVFVRLLVVIGDAVALAESGELRLVTAQSDELRAEVAHVSLEHRGRVAARIDADEEHTDLRGLRAQGTQRIGQGGERRRALVRTLGV